ncbi:MAG: hypothetical protein AB2823_13870 [Candidatus Thiodiazotropha endolucinida]
MGLFDSVSTNMVDGSATNSCGFLYDFTISDRIGHVAQAYALNEHRPLFPLDSIGHYGGGGLSANRVEQGFLGAHSDLGAGYNRNRPGCRREWRPIGYSLAMDGQPGRECRYRDGRIEYRTQDNQ